ncbi:MAG: hypothetical protein AAF763_17055 [Pseudomonadota bacterium]
MASLTDRSAGAARIVIAIEVARENPVFEVSPLRGDMVIDPSKDVRVEGLEVIDGRDADAVAFGGDGRHSVTGGDGEDALRRGTRKGSADRSSGRDRPKGRMPSTSTTRSSRGARVRRLEDVPSA